MSTRSANVPQIYNRVRLLRVEWGMSRAELADRVSVNVQTIGALERGDHFPSLNLAFSVCEVFGLPVEAVFSRTEFAPRGAEYYQSAMPGREE